MTNRIAIIIYIIVSTSSCTQAWFKSSNSEDTRIIDCVGNWEFIEFHGDKEARVLLASKAWHFDLLSYPNQLIAVLGSDTIAILYENVEWLPKIGDSVAIKPVTRKDGLEGGMKLPTKINYKDKRLNDLYCSVKYCLYADCVELRQ